MNLKDYVSELAKILDQPDVQEVTFNIGIELINHEVTVNAHSPNRVTFTVARNKVPRKQDTSDWKANPKILMKK